MDTKGFLSSLAREVIDLKEQQSFTTPANGTSQSMQQMELRMLAALVLEGSSLNVVSRADIGLPARQYPPPPTSA